MKHLKNNDSNPIIEPYEKETIYNDHNAKLLRTAQYENNPELIKEIIKNGAQINAQDEYGSTALHIATQYNNNDVVSTLIKLKTDLNMQDQQGNTALHYAVIIKNKIATEALITVGANPNIKNNDNKTALKIAQKRNDHKMLKILIPSATHKIRTYYKKKPKA